MRAEIQQRLASKSDDAEALAMKGEMLLDGGDEPAAVAVLERAYALEPAPRTRELLRDVMLDGLRTQFPAYRGRLSEIEPLLESPAQRAALLRLMAEGLRRSGELAGAFDYCEKLMGLEPDRQPLDESRSPLFRAARPVDPRADDRPLPRSARQSPRRRSGWSTGCHGRRRARGRRRQNSARRRPRSCGSSPSGATRRWRPRALEPLEKWLAYFDGTPGARPARAELARRLGRAGQALAAELAAWPEPPPAVAAVEAIWQPAPCGGHTLAHRASRDRQRPDQGPGPERQRLRAAGSAGRAPPALRRQRTRVSAEQPDGGQLRRARQRAVVGLAGRPLGAAGILRTCRPAGHARLRHGHLLLLSLGWKVAALDTTGAGRKTAPRLLWVHDVLHTAVPVEGGRRVGALPLPGFAQEQLASGVEPPRVLNRNYVCYTRFRTLIAVDPLSGEMLWVRSDMPSQCDLFGDEEYVFALPADSEEATVFRAVDGAARGQAQVAAGSGALVICRPTFRVSAAYRRPASSAFATRTPAT